MAERLRFLVVRLGKRWPVAGGEGANRCIEIEANNSHARHITSGGRAPPDLSGSCHGRTVERACLSQTACAITERRHHSLFNSPSAAPTQSLLEHLGAL